MPSINAFTRTYRSPAERTRHGSNDYVGGFEPFGGVPYRAELACLEVAGARIASGREWGGVRMRAAWRPDAFGAGFVWGPGTRINGVMHDRPVLALSGVGTEFTFEQDGPTRNLRVGLRGSTLDELRAAAGTAAILEPWLGERGLVRPRTCPRAEWRLQARILHAARIAERTDATAPGMAAAVSVAADDVVVALVALLATAKPPADELRATRSGVARAAAAFLAARPDEPVSILAVCRAVAVSERTLQRAFRETYGRSFRAYERERRLRAVHGAILTEGDRRSITDIAMSFGFWHLGRFAAAYAGCFGCAPTETRRRVWRSWVEADRPAS
jgi:AraC family transcriptional regulator, ethanolamine operon transcriptional activator